MINSHIDFDKLNSSNHPNVIFRGIGGSRSYGTHNKQSDLDIRGIFIEERNSYLSLAERQNQYADERGDICYYSLRRFFELASASNPNILEILFLPDDCILRHTYYSKILYENRMLFISKIAASSYLDYALAQVKKAKGKNKKVHNPCPEEAPVPEKFCWFLPSDSGRSIPISDSSCDLSSCRVASVGHLHGLYRLYDYKKKGRGVFRNEMIVCDSIPVEDEKKYFCGFLIFNQDAFERAKIEHRQYWEWRKNRNDSRWKTQENCEIDYDAKNMMHTFRLLDSGRNILEKGEPLVRFSGEKLQFLLDVKRGLYTYEELLARIDSLADKLAELRKRTSLPEHPDMDIINKLLLDITLKWEDSYAP